MVYRGPIKTTLTLFAIDNIIMFPKITQFCNLLKIANVTKIDKCVLNLYKFNNIMELC